ncbi:lysophospholipase L1-like esterase [Marisediminicola sp. UYEF4]|uniref:SGNH/GDSL hydrolase family protein n=1 Tax=Marisediminicola sp. UYEF4 TaxID=1756384 RepID=UPI00339B0AA8
MTQTQRSRIRFMPRLGAVSLLSLGLVVAASVAPVSASPGAAPNGSAGGSYVAIGDSFTSGQGAAPWLPGPCLQSVSSSYPAITAGSSSYREALNFACSGADTTATIAQLADIDDRVESKASLVTITVGGIDAGSNQVLAACAPDPTSALCAFAVNTASANLPGVGTKLVGTYSAVAAAFPKARIVVLNYPRLFDPSFPSPLVGPVNSATDALNSVIAGAVAATGNPRVSLTDVTDEFAGHGIGSAESYISFDLASPAAFHPNALGNTAGYAAALRTDGAVRGR